MTDLYGAPAPKPKRESKPKPPVDRCCWTCKYAQPTLNAAGRRDPNREVACLWNAPPFDWPEAYIYRREPPNLRHFRHPVFKHSGKDCACWTEKEKPCAK